MNPSRNWVYWAGLITAAVSSFLGCWQSMLHRPAGWQFTSAVIAIIPLIVIIQYAARLFAPHKIQSLIDHLTTRQRLALYWLHYLALAAFFVVAAAFLCVDIVPRIQTHRGLLQLLWINSILLVICIADLSGTTTNVWRPQKTYAAPSTSSGSTSR